MLEIKNFEMKYFEDVRQVCINTGPQKAKTDPGEKDRLLAIYCDYYCEQEPQNAFILVDENDRAQGYIFCSENAKEYHKKFKPYMKRVRKQGLVACLIPWGEKVFYNFKIKKYPAHLHIDINHEFTGNGNGTRLMQTLCEHLKSKGVCGVQLMVSTSNTAAIRFYKRNGFKSICSVGGATAMAKEL